MIHAASPALPLGLGLVGALTTKEKAPNLREDQRGAVMITGLFMAFFLVGALWYVIGVGDAVIFRDRMQEAADHAAFTSAALHAKGMNFIAACNIVMLLLVAVHIILGIIHDFALAACILSLGTGCGGWLTARRIYTGYEKFFKPALTVIHYIEMGAGYGYPYIGAVKGYQMGTNYGNQGKIAGVTTIPLSTSMIPGALYGGEKTGLPVSAEPFDYLCGKLVNMIFDWVKENVPLPGLGFIGGIVNSIFGGETVEDIVKKILGAGIKLRYCNALGGGTLAQDPFGSQLFKQMGRGEKKIEEQNAEIDKYNANRKQGEPPRQKLEDPQIRKGTGAIGGPGNWNSILDPGFDRGWGQDGPYVVIDGAENGSDQMQVWAVNINPKYRDVSEKRVNVASKPGRANLLGDTNQGPFGYFAQAEFYFDCTEGWDDGKCNGGNGDDNTMFSIKWRARLRHVELPNFGALLGNFGLDAIMGSQTYQDIKDKLAGDGSIFDDLAKGPLGAVGIDVLKQKIDDIISDLEGAVRDGVTGALGTPTGLSGSYH
jgi:hypothetical protein